MPCKQKTYKTLRTCVLGKCIYRLSNMLSVVKYIIIQIFAFINSKMRYFAFLVKVHNFFRVFC